MITARGECVMGEDLPIPKDSTHLGIDGMPIKIVGSKVYTYSYMMSDWLLSRYTKDTIPNYWKFEEIDYENS